MLPVTIKKAYIISSEYWDTYINQKIEIECDITEQIQTLFGEDYNWNNTFYKPDSLSGIDCIGKTIYVIYDNPNSTREKDDCYAIQIKDADTYINPGMSWPLKNV